MVPLTLMTKGSMPLPVSGVMVMALLPEVLGMVTVRATLLAPPAGIVGADNFAPKLPVSETDTPRSVVPGLLSKKVFVVPATAKPKL